MIDASSVGMFEMYSKVQKNRLIFYYEVEKKTKKQTHGHELTFSLLILLFSLLMMTTDGVPHCRFLWRTSQVTDNSPTSPSNFLLPVCELRKSSLLAVTQTHHSEELTPAWESECCSQDASNPYDPASQVDWQEPSHSFWYFMYFTSMTG